jgi:phage shock protein A
MGIFSRITEIVNSNINAMLDMAEDPEKLVKLMINEMEDTLTEVKSAAAEVVADKIRLTRNRVTESNRRGEWEARANLALEKGREDLAREAVEQKLECEKRIIMIDKRLLEVEALVAQYQSDIARLEEKLQSAYARQRTLIANHQSALNRRKVEEKIYRLSTHGAFAKFENFENRIDRYQAEVELLSQSNNTLEHKFLQLEHGKEIDQELAALKARLALPERKSAKTAKLETAEVTGH